MMTYGRGLDRGGKGMGDMGGLERGRKLSMCQWCHLAPELFIS